MRPRILVGLAAFVVLSFAAPGWAHHSFSAEFDGSQRATLSGKITKLEWLNPHVYFHIEAKDDTGKLAEWDIESWPTRLLHKSGVTRERLAPNQEVTIVVARAKDGTKNLGWLRNIKFADGSYFELSATEPGTTDNPSGPPK